MQFLYNIFIHIMIFGMKMAAPFNDKIKKGLEGRKQSCEIVKSAFKKEDRIIWMHVASLGEYEQGLPVLEKLKEKFPHHKVLISFFSPSGYEIIANKKNIADAVCYLPFDLKHWITEFTAHFSTEIFFTVKYDYWYNLLKHLKKNGVQTYVVSALFYETQVFFSSYGKWFTESLRENIDWFFHQNKNSSALAKSIGLSNSVTTGDTRFDRVKQLKSRKNSIEFIDNFKQNQTLIVFGSSWNAEEKIAEIVAKKLPHQKIIIAPHDLKRVENLKEIFPKAILYSEFAENLNSSSTVLIIDSIGLLSRLYSYADLAIVGGGFHSAGLHNILEPAVFSVPVVFGNHYLKNPEADALIAENGAQSFVNEYVAADFVVKVLQDENLRKSMAKNAGNFVEKQPNATEKIVEKIAMLYQRKFN